MENAVRKYKFFTEKELSEKGMELKEKLDKANRGSLMGACIRLNDITEFGIFGSYYYSTLFTFFNSKEFNTALEFGLDFIKRRGGRTVSKEEIVKHPELENKYKDSEYILFNNKTAFAYRDSCYGEPHNIVRLNILFKVGEMDGGGPICKSKHFATICVIKPFMFQNGGPFHPVDYYTQGAFLSLMSTELSLYNEFYNVPPIDKENIINDAKCSEEDKFEYTYNDLMDEWDDIQEYIALVDERSKLLIKFNGFCINQYHIYSSEGCIDGAKRIVSLAIKRVIEFFKYLAELFKRIIDWVINIIKCKTHLRIMNSISAKSDPVSLSQAYDIYGKLNILDETIEGIPELRELAKEEIQYMKYSDLSFRDEVQRASVAASIAVKSIKTVLETSLNENVWLRTGGAELGNAEQENNVKNDERNVLELYQDKMFQRFVYQVDKYTSGNINSFIKERNRSRGMGIYSKFDYAKYNGADLAKSLILNKKIDDVAYIAEKSIRSNKTNIPINEVITKELLLKIRNKDKNIIKEIEETAGNTIKSCEALKRLSEKYYEELRRQINILEKGGNSVSEGINSINDSQQWMKILIDFSRYLFNHQLNVLGTARRATYILAKKSSVPVERKTPVENNTSIGYIPFISKRTFEKLSKENIYKLSREVMKRQISKLGGVSIQPNLLIIRNGRKIESDSGIQLGNCLGLYSGVDDKLINNIMLLCGKPNVDENKLDELITKYDEMVDNCTYTSKDEECKLKGIVVRLRYNEIINVIVNSYPYPDEYLPTYYLGIIVHESTHIKQIADIERTIKESKDVDSSANKSDVLNSKLRERKLNDELEEEHYKIVEKIMDVHEEFINLIDNFENEANSEEIKYNMSVVNATCTDENKKDYIEEELNKI